MFHYDVAVEFYVHCNSCVRNFNEEVTKEHVSANYRSKCALF
jgi:hypothetical protein